MSHCPSVIKTPSSSVSRMELPDDFSRRGLNGIPLRYRSLLDNRRRYRVAGIRFGHENVASCRAFGEESRKKQWSKGKRPAIGAEHAIRIFAH